MSAKLSLVFLVAFVAVQLITTETRASIVRREVVDLATTEKSALEEAAQSFKTGVEELLKKIQENELFQNVTKKLNELADDVKQKAREVTQKINEKPAAEN